MAEQYGDEMTRGILEIVTKVGPAVIRAMSSLESQPHGAATLGAFAMIMGLTTRMNAKPERREAAIEGVCDHIRKIASSKELSVAVYHAMFGMDAEIPPELEAD